MTEQELRKRCGLKPNQLISTNKGLVDILGVGRDPKTDEEKVVLGFLATGRVVTEPINSVIKKLTNSHGILN